MDDMRKLHRLGAVSDDWMKELEAAHKRDQSLEAFGQFIREKESKHARGGPRAVSGGNKKYLSKAQRKKKRKAQRKARRVRA